MRYITLLCAMMVFVSANAQDKKTMHVHVGQREFVFSVEAVDSIGFDEGRNGGMESVHAVDLGLSVKWASCNLGGFMPYARGEYYAWGETDAKESYTWNTYMGGSLHDADDCGTSRDPLMHNSTIAGTGYDAASAILGGKWRMPTLAEMKELLTCCSWRWGSQGGVSGYHVTGPKGTSIFLPMAGVKDDDSLCNEDACGIYLSGTRASGYADLVYCLCLDSQTAEWSLGARLYGHSIRPVSEY